MLMIKIGKFELWHVKHRNESGLDQLVLQAHNHKQHRFDSIRLYVCVFIQELNILLRKVSKQNNLFFAVTFLKGFDFSNNTKKLIMFVPVYTNSKRNVYIL